MSRIAHCELKLYSRKPSGTGKKRVWPVCGKPAVYRWLPRGLSFGSTMLLCRECGEGAAGNFVDELTPIATEAKSR